MKLIHLADLHFGKAIHGVSLVEEDQLYWTERFLELTDAEKPQAVMIAGDVYDRSAPSAEAVVLLDRLLTGLVDRGIQVMLVAGNHDSGQKLSFGGKLLEKQGLHIAGIVGRGLQHVVLRDEYGPVTFWLLPYVFPALAGDVLQEDIRDYDAAVRRMIAAQDIDFTQRNVMIAHQNVMAHGVQTQRGGSETMIGGVGEVDYTAFDGFSYAALGHIHAAQAVGRPAVRYAGSPLCYHFSETKQPAKGPVIVELNAPGTPPVIRTCLIPALHPMREIAGTLEEIVAAEKHVYTRGEYLRVVLRDGHIPPAARETLDAMFAAKGSVILEMVSDASMTPGTREAVDTYREKSITELFAEFYANRTGEEQLDARQLAIVQRVAEYAIDGNNAEKPADVDVDALIAFIAAQED